MKVFLIVILMLLAPRVALQMSLTGLSMASSTNSHAPILIIGNSAFTQANGVTSGSGTSLDPFVISKWQISAPSGNGVTIVNTTSNFVIHGVAISSTLRGIYLHNVTNGLVRNSTISNNDYGVLVEQSSSISISNNVMSNNSMGILIENCTKVPVVGDQIYSAQFRQTPALVVRSSPGSIISNNNIWFSGNAVSLYNTADALVTGNNVSYNAGIALSLTSSPNAKIPGNLISHNIVGISLLASDNASITSNTVYWNRSGGIGVSSNNATVSKNVIAFNGDGAGISCCGKSATVRGNNFTRDGLALGGLCQCVGYGPYPAFTITSDNLVNGKPLAFYSGCSNLDINGISVGQLILLNCNNIRITHLEIYNTFIGIQLVNVNNTLIASNSVNSNRAGISLSGFSNITVTGNNLSNNGGAYLPAGLIATPFEPYTRALTAYHNNLFYDEIFDSGQNDRFYNGYPSGGNYWAQYKGVDNCGGPNQNICPNPDGIGDTPYVSTFSYSNPIRDPYPLMRPYLPTPDNTPPVWLPNAPLNFTNVGQTQVTLHWLSAADDVVVATYEIYRGSTLIANISADRLVSSQYLAGYGYSYVAGNLTAGATYTFRIVAVDEAGNRSVSGPTANISMQPQQPPNIFSPMWWQQYWYVVAVAGGGGAALLGFLIMRRRKKVVAPPLVVTPDSSTEIAALRRSGRVRGLRGNLWFSSGGHFNTPYCSRR